MAASQYAIGSDLARADRITLTGVECYGYHGVLETEKQVGQPFIVDLTAFTDFSAAVASDDVAHTINYAEVAEVIRQVVTDGSLNLIETLVVKIAQKVLDSFPVLAVEVTVNKPQAPIEVPFGNVSVTAFREKK